VIDDEDLALRPADAVQLLEQARRRSTTETTYIATTLSKLASGNVISSAFILEQRLDVRELAVLHPGARLVSISVDTSMPVTRVCVG